MLKGTIMTKMMIIVVLGFASSMAYVDLASDLRSLHGTVSEMAATSKELGAISNQHATQANQQQGAQAASNELKSGDVLTSKINKIKLFKEPSKNLTKQVFCQKVTI
jgi:hypothetical protein